MNRLLIMRHAKSDQHVLGLTDHERPLNARGERDAPRMGKRLLELGIQPDAIVSSTAVRAERTAQLFADGNAYAGPLRADSRLYLCEVRNYIEVLGELPESAGTVLVVSHNPGSEELLAYLTGVMREMPTAAIALVEGELDAALRGEARPHCTLKSFWIPKDE